MGALLAKPRGDAHAREIFNLIDKDGNGKLSLKELNEAASKYAGELEAAWSKATIESVIARHDRNNDGQLDMDEWQKAIVELRAKVDGGKKPVPPAGGKEAAAEGGSFLMPSAKVAPAPPDKARSKREKKLTTVGSRTSGPGTSATTVAKRDEQHVSWSESLRHKTRSTLSGLEATFGIGVSTVLSSNACVGDGMHTFIVRVISTDTYLSIGMAAPMETNERCKQLGTFGASVGLRDDGMLARDTRFTKDQGAFAIGDVIRVDYECGRVQWYHGASKLSLLLAEVEDVPSGWHFGASGMSALVEILELPPHLTAVEKELLETRRKHRERLKHAKNLAARLEKVKVLTSDQVEAAAAGPEAAATHFAINSALLAVPELSVPWGNLEKALETISLRDRHRALTSGGTSGLFEQVALKELELQQQQLKATFAAATDGLMQALAPHLAEFGVTINDTLPNGRHVVASILEAASPDGMEQLEALMANPRELAKQCAAVKLPSATFGFRFQLDAVGSTADADYKKKLAQFFGVSPMQVEELAVVEGDSSVELQAKIKIFDAESGMALLGKISKPGDEWPGVRVLGAPIVESPVLTRVKTAEDKVVETCSFNFLRADALRSGIQPLATMYYQQINDLDTSLFVTKEIRMDDVLKHAYMDEILVVSHRWEQPFEKGGPDPRGTQECEIRNFLIANPKIKYVWHDYWCLPQGERTNDESETFGRMLHSVNLVYLGAIVLILLDREYAVRFWTSAEAWLGMQECTPTGLQPARAPGERCKIVLLPGVDEAQRGALIQLWARTPIKEACDRLAGDEIKVTNKGDKQKLLVKLKKLHETIGSAWKAMQVARLVEAVPVLERIIDKEDEAQLFMCGGQLLEAASAAEAKAAADTKAAAEVKAAVEVKAVAEAAARNDVTRLVQREKDFCNHVVS